MGIATTKEKGKGEGKGRQEADTAEYYNKIWNNARR